MYFLGMPGNTIDDSEIKCLKFEFNQQLYRFDCEK